MDISKKVQETVAEMDKVLSQYANDSTVQAEMAILIKHKNILLGQKNQPQRNNSRVNHIHKNKQTVS